MSFKGAARLLLDLLMCRMLSVSFNQITSETVFFLPIDAAQVHHWSHAECLSFWLLKHLGLGRISRVPLRNTPKNSFLFIASCDCAAILT
jgi:hypothetical protein